jgi:hypothetical protein
VWEPLCRWYNRSLGFKIGADFVFHMLEGDHMPSCGSIIFAAAILAFPSVTLAQPSPPPPPAAPSPPPPNSHPPHANLQWNADRFHFDFDDGVCHQVLDYNFKTGDVRVDRRGDCSHVNVPRP